MNENRNRVAGAGAGGCVLALMLALMLVLGALGGCGPKPPIRIGFAGGVVAHGFNVSEDGRNGALVAVDAINRDGGVRGRPLELVVREISETPEAARATVQDLRAAGVQAVVGPFTSTQARAMLAQADATGTLLLSPTANAPELVGRDDQLLRLNGALADSAEAYAALLTARGQQRLAVAFDEGNLAYSGPWLAAFRTSLQALGGEVVAQAGFKAGAEVSHLQIVQGLLASAPDGLLFISRGAEVAQLAQQVRKLGAALPLATAEWAATDSLIQLGGGAVEGLVTAQPYDPEDTSPRYLAFRTAYRERYAREASFGAIGAHDAVMVLAQALQRATDGQAPKDAVLRHGPYQGLQHAIVFDRFGDSRRRLHFVVVRNGAFVALR